MINGLSVLALVVARGGSKGLPGKNIRDVLGRPLIQWTIDAARGSHHIDRLVLSSDDDAIMDAARAGGCDVPFTRPPELATDTASAVDVALDALDRVSGHDVLLLLQPTSPLRTTQDIDAALELLASANAPACVGVRPAEDHPFWTFRTDADGRLIAYAHPDKDQVVDRRQDLPPAWCVNGAIYAIHVGELRRTRSFMPEGTVAYTMPPERSIDIDTPQDFERMIALVREQAASELTPNNT